MATAAEPARGSIDARIVAALSGAGGTCKPGELWARLGVAPAYGRQGLRRLTAAGRVVATGATLSRVLSLSRRAAKEGL